jgi:TIR domain
MIEPVRRLRIFVASPGDVDDERKRLAHVVEDLRIHVATAHGLDLELVRWETHMRPGAGDDAQAVITPQIGPYDLFIGILWNRFGTPTKRAGPGTREEFDQAYDRWQKDPSNLEIWVYFSQQPYTFTSAQELEQRAKVLAFKQELQKEKGLLVWTYKDPADFEEQVRGHLSSFIIKHASSVRPVAPQLPPPSVRDQIFISYSHKDKKWLEMLNTSLKAILRNKKISLWDDTKIKPGEEWREEIKNALSSAKVAVLLVTPDFLASDFIAVHELPSLLEAAKKEGLTVLWVAVRESLYKETEIGRYQAVNDPARPLSGLRKPDQDRAIKEICEQIKLAATPPSVHELTDADPLLLAWRLVVDFKAEPDLLLHLDPTRFHEAIDKLGSEAALERGATWDQKLTMAHRHLESKHGNEAPNALWLAWMNNFHAFKVNALKLPVAANPPPEVTIESGESSSDAGEVSPTEPNEGRQRLRTKRVGKKA